MPRPEKPHSGRSGSSAAAIIQTLESLVERVESAVDARNDGRSVNSTLEAATRSLKRARAQLERGDEAAADESLTTASNQLGATLNTVGSGRSAPLDEPLERAVENYSTLVIEHLADAREMTHT